jgi:C4-dicarboxylate-specific signal transduction histidine kinase
MLTGGARSPAALFYVFHMVFASLLLPRTMAYGAAFAAVSMLVAGLWLEGTLERSLLLVAAHALTLGFSVFLANRIVQRLRRQNRRVRRIGRRLRRHQRAMVQHEKMFALGQLAANVTHEIANPLASMDSLLQLMQRRPERMSESALATLRQQIQRISEIIRQMKAFAHPHEMQRAVASPNEIVDEAVKIIRLDPRARRTTIETCLASEVGQISFMPQALQQVLVNLLINALDATADTPAPRITVRTGRKDDWVLIDVIDNGTGIAPQHLRRLFEPFFTTKPVGKGTGLGLSISYTLIERQGGSIGVRSTAGQGAQFTIRLPGCDLSRRRDVAAAPVAVSEKPAGG